LTDIETESHAYASGDTDRAHMLARIIDAHASIDTLVGLLRVALHDMTRDQLDVFKTDYPEYRDFLGDIE
jgi:hypothetical protein